MTLPIWATEKAREIVSHAWRVPVATALRDARAMGPEWQPIETAPKDGTQILMVIAGYEPLCGRWRRGTWTSDPDKAYFSPTHWQPLPAAPKES